MSVKSIRSKEAVRRHVERNPGALRGAGFFYALTCALLRPSEPNEAEAVCRAMKAAAPPTQCPACGFPCTFAVRDPQGDWTWCCQGGCNP